MVTTFRTSGFGVRTVVKKNLSFTVQGVGGQDKVRFLWRQFLPGYERSDICCQQQRSKQGRGRARRTPTEDSPWMWRIPVKSCASEACRCVRAAMCWRSSVPRSHVRANSRRSWSCTCTTVRVCLMTRPYPQALNANVAGGTAANAHLLPVRQRVPQAARQQRVVADIRQASTRARILQPQAPQH